MSRSLTGKEQKIISNGQRAKVISSGRLQRVAMIELAAEAALTVQGEAASVGPAVEADPVIWTAKLRTGRVVIFGASGSRAFRAAALIGSVAVEDSVVTALVAAGLAGLAAAAGSGAGAEN